MTPYYQDDFVTIYHGDCREIMPSLAFSPSLTDCVLVTDPPYGINYSSGPANLGATQYEPIAGDDSYELAEWALTQGVRFVVFGAHEFPHLLAPGGRWFCWDKRLSAAADRMIGTPFELAYGSMPGANVMLRCLHGGVVNANGAGHKRQHPTEKPIPMLRQLLTHVTGEVVVDTFMGSGTTLRAAKDLGRRAIGIEISEAYCEIAARRMAQEVLDFGSVA